MTLSAEHIKFFEDRGIEPETVIRFEIFSGRRVRAGADEAATIQPDANGKILVFPYLDRLSLDPGAKYRGPQKKFWQKPGARKTFWNADVLDDPALADARNALVITEGEMDALSAIQAGYPFAVSVPDGAPPDVDKEGKKIAVPVGADDIDPEHDDKYAFIFNNWERLKLVKRIIVATDTDGPGQRLAAELVRRLDRVRCSWVTMPADCKDLNEVLRQHGREAVLKVIFTAKEYPVSGLYRLSEMPTEPDLQPVSTGWGRLNPFIKVFTPCLMVVTGFAGQGKSTWTQQLVAHLARDQGWVTAIASFEMRIRPYVTDALSTVLLDKAKWSRDGEQWRCEWSKSEQARAEAWIESHFVFIGPDPQASDESHDIQWLIDRGEAAVIRHGARVLLIDPWNEVEHLRRRDESQTEYVGRAIRELKRFSKNFGVLVIIVAHPTKSATQKSPDEVSLYDISDSAHFANKADLGLVIARRGDPQHDTTTSIFVKKVRYQPETGMPGEIDVNFDRTMKIFGQ